MLPRIAFSDTEARFSMFWTPRRKYGQNRTHEHDFRRFGFLRRSMAKIDPRSTIFDVLESWADVWPKSIPEARFSTFWTPGRKYGPKKPQDWAQEAPRPLGGSMGSSHQMAPRWTQEIHFGLFRLLATKWLQEVDFD